MKKRINGNGKVAGLSEISVRWLRLGIQIERINPAHPQQNGRHERMHLTLKREATKPASRNSLKQQERFDRFVHIFNDERPHEALGMKYPTELYVSSSRPYKGLSEPQVSSDSHTVRALKSTEQRLNGVSRAENGERDHSDHSSICST